MKDWFKPVFHNFLTYTLHKLKLVIPLVEFAHTPTMLTLNGKEITSSLRNIKTNKIFCNNMPTQELISYLV